MILAGTGHRPNKLGGYYAQAEEDLRWFATRFLKDGPATHVVTGMAQGWDTALAVACVRLCIPFTAAVPFDGQDARWPSGVRDLYAKLLAQASRVVVCSPGGYSPKAMQIRNEWMVDNCDQVVALWNGTPGGTSNCVRYCESVGRSWVNLWPLWSATRGR